MALRFRVTAGMGRAAAVILAYLVQQGYDLSQAQAVLCDQHPASAPSIGAVVAATSTCDGQAAEAPRITCRSGR